MVDRFQEGAASGGRPAAEGDAALGLVQLSRLVQDCFARVADRHHLSPLQGRLLCVLAEAPRGMAELARVFGVEKATITGLVDRAEIRELVERAPVPGDRRAVSVVLTRHGRRSAADFHLAVTGELHQLLSPLTPQRQELFTRSMTTITQTAGLSANWSGYRPG